MSRVFVVRTFDIGKMAWLDITISRARKWRLVGDAVVNV